ncbi:hypothetical protein LTS10_006126 [Elasticomyces elasticus]|nr:hypothetical protein LTS10_006126 [Elasticomyces elasticus]
MTLLHHAVTTGDPNIVLFLSTVDSYASNDKLNCLRKPPEQIFCDAWAGDCPVRTYNTPCVAELVRQQIALLKAGLNPHSSGGVIRTYAMVEALLRYQPHNLAWRIAQDGMDQLERCCLMGTDAGAQLARLLSRKCDDPIAGAIAEAQIDEAIAEAQLDRRRGDERAVWELIAGRPPNPQWLTLYPTEPRLPSSIGWVRGDPIPRWFM